MITGSHHQQIYWYATGRNRLLGQLPGAYLIAEQRWIPRAPAVLHPPARTGVLRDGPLEQHLYRLPRHERQAASSTRRSDRSRSRRRSSTRRVAEFGIACEACHGPSTEHARRQPQSAAPLRVASDRPRRCDHRAADAARPAALVAGLRPVPRRLGVLRCRRRAPGKQRGAAVSARRRAVEDAVRRAADAQCRLADDEGAARGRSRASCATRSGRTEWFACRAANTTG